MTVEQRLDQLEKRNKRLTVALTMTVVAMVSTGHKGDVFKKVTVRRVFVMNEGGEVVVARGVKDDGTEKYEKRPL